MSRRRKGTCQRRSQSTFVESEGRVILNTVECGRAPGGRAGAAAGAVRLIAAQPRRAGSSSHPVRSNVAMYTLEMDISVSRFKQSCLAVVRQVEATGQPVAITRRGKVVARLSPATAVKSVPPMAPWERVRAVNGAECRFEAGESVLSESEFEAAR